MGVRAQILASGIVAILIFSPLAWAAPVYKTTDSRGHEVYSNSPGEKTTKPHSLPEIMKGSFRAPASAKVSKGCTDHGGLDCASGPDVDGSIQCKDGVRTSGLLFRYVCPMAKLEVVEVVQVPGSSTASLIIRNVRSVVATKLVVKIRGKSSAALHLKGPPTLEEGAIGVYEVYIPKGVLPGGSQEVSRNQLWITCANCG